MHTSTILTIAGSLRQHSFNRKLIAAARSESPEHAHLSEWSGLAAIPPFDEDAEAHPAPRPVAELRAAIAAADGVLIATPEYNGSIPGQLKNALDWASRPREASVLEGKPVAVMGASPSPSGAASAQADLRKVLGRSRAEVIGDELTVPAAFRQLDEHDRLLDVQLRAQLRALITELHAAGSSQAPVPA